MRESPGPGGDKKIPKCRPDLEATPPDAQNTRAHKNSVIYYTIWRIAKHRLALAAAKGKRKKEKTSRHKEKKSDEGDDVGKDQPEQS